MYCRKCGTPNDENAFRCVSCGTIIQDVWSLQLEGEKVPNYLVQSILVTLFCCLPLGVVGIVYAAQVNPKLQAGDRSGALHSSRNAKNWTLAGFVIGLLVLLFYVLVAIAAETGTL